MAFPPLTVRPVGGPSPYGQPRLTRCQGPQLSPEDEQHSLLYQPPEKHLYWYPHTADALTSGTTSARALSMSTLTSCLLISPTY
ncbi:hypothetical protein ACTWPT_44815 [Nonomuraea sp. 3N208]|uniref:hypothetical protein n=1 Tax=Nonomuraea sp. 3N208 TaxID=3457421 RepID=UPI003FCF78AA